jgi:hypothetical protein
MYSGRKKHPFGPFHFISSTQIFVHAADNLHAFRSANQISSDRRAVLFFPVEASLVSPPALDAEPPFGAEVDWLAAPRASAAQVLAGAAWWVSPAQDALAVLAAESGAPAVREAAQEQEVSQA